MFKGELNMIAPDIIMDIIRKNEIRRRHAAEKSKFKIGQLVRVTDDLDKLEEYFMKIDKNFREARIGAHAVAGNIMKVFLVEEFPDEKGLYVNLEDQYGYFHLLPEDLVRDYRER